MAKYTFKMTCWNTGEQKKMEKATNLTLNNKTEEEAIIEAKRICKREHYRVTDISQV